MLAGHDLFIETLTIKQIDADLRLDVCNIDAAASRSARVIRLPSRAFGMTALLCLKVWWCFLCGADPNSGFPPLVAGIFTSMSAVE
jgi:hypothetical protein